MPISKLRPALLSLAPLAFVLQGCASYPAAESPAPPPAPVAEPPAPTGPGLWKVADEDTTIYLFGTVHALPESVEWYRGPIEQALAQTQELVTEIPSGAALDPAAQQQVMTKALLADGRTLRDVGLTAKQEALFVEV